MTERHRCWAVIPAAGVGARMAADKPKQYLRVGGRTVIEWTLEKLAAQRQLSGVVVALAADDRQWDALQIDSPLPIWRAEGGSERCHSVLNALQVLGEHARGEDWVLVHDAARPCLRRADLDKLLDTLTDDPVGGLLALPVRDTMKRSDAKQRIIATEDRQGLWHALTPQMFRLQILQQAIQDSLDRDLMVTDESAAVEALGLQPQLVEGCADNIKITRPGDLALAELFLKHRD